MQIRGFNGVSYADVTAELGITKAALHYHFASKAELGTALIDRYTERFDAALADDRLQRPVDAPSKISAYAAIYLDVLRQTNGCACAACLPPSTRPCQGPMQQARSSASSTSTRPGSKVCSTRVSRRARCDHRGSARKAAQIVIGTLEGAMLVARLHDDPARLEIATDQLLAGMA